MPHGDTSVYEAMVILAQDFSTRYPLIDIEGNKGSVDGDPAAAMRYTLGRLSRFGQTMLNDINKNTIDFKSNYDGEEQEPKVLPSLLPVMLLNGSFGIAVGLATKIPSHNIVDIYNACYHIIDNTVKGIETDIEQVINIIKAPDFATGGTIMGLAGVKEGYRTGKGKVVIRSKYNIVEDKKGSIITITEIPYKVNKQKLVENIIELMKNVTDSKGVVTRASVFPQIREVRDESDKDGMRIIIEVKKDESAQIVINNLIKQTAFQTNFSMNMIALVDSQPKQMNILELLELFLAHSASVIIRKAQFELEKANVRLNIVNGILQCLSSEDILSNVISTIRHSEDPVVALMSLGFNQLQAEYISEMKIRSLSNSSETKLRTEFESLNASILENTAIIEDDTVMLAKMESEFKELEKQFGDERRTNLEFDGGSIDDEDLVKDETLIITYTTDGMLKAVEEGEYKSQKRGGKGVKATNTKTDEIIKFMFTSNSKDDLLFFTTEGRCHTLKAYKINKSSKIAKGKSINNYLNLNVGEKIVSVLNTSIKNKENHLLFVTKKGQIKKLSLEQLSTRYPVTRVIDFYENDSLVQALLVEDKDNILIVTSLGMSIRLDTCAEGNKTIRPTGRTAKGVSGINVSEQDEVVDMCIVDDNMNILTVTENGLAKMTKANEWKIIGRGGKGVVAHNLSEKTGRIISVMTANGDEELFIATEQGLITRIPSNGIRICGRSSIGVKAINLNNEDKVASVSVNRNDDILEDS